MTPAVESIFDVAFWFSDTALHHNEYLQPQKLHRLMFLAQAYYSVAFGGRKLMPAFFVAEEMGPVEPNIYRAFNKGRPDIDAELFLHEEVESFLESIWRRFGHHSTERLANMTKETLAYKQAFKKGRRTEITLQAMRLSFSRASESPGLDQVIRPKMMVSQTGQPVAVKAWKPGSSPGLAADTRHEPEVWGVKGVLARAQAHARQGAGKPWQPVATRTKRNS